MSKRDPAARWSGVSRRANDAIRSSETEPLIDRLAAIFPRQEGVASRIALAIYGLLARHGRATSAEIARATDTSSEMVAAQLDAWPAVYRDETGVVIGFWGLTGRKMGHSFTIHGKERFAWCAWDALFIPEIVGAPAEVNSVTPVDGREIRLAVTPTEAKVLAPENGRLLVSFRLPLEDDWQEDVVSSFCHHVYFVLEDEAERWLKKNPDSVLLTLDDAFRAGRLKNRVQFDTLGGRDA